MELRLQISASSSRNAFREKQGRDACPINANTTGIKDDGGQDSVQEAKGLQDSLVGPQVESADESSRGDNGTGSISPYSSNRAAIRNLTMPSQPDLDVPPSPTGSPPPVMEEKFEHFLQLKRQGVHFNEKLAGSSALKNPALLQKLMTSAGLSASDQYATTLPKDLWDPSAFPKHAYKEELVSNQQQISKRKEKENLHTQRERVDFVPAANPEKSVRGDGMASMSGSTGKRDSATERVAASLGQQKNHSSPGARRRVT